MKKFRIKIRDLRRVITEELECQVDGSGGLRGLGDENPDLENDEFEAPKHVTNGMRENSRLRLPRLVETGDVEGQMPDQDAKKEEGEDSLDSQIDRYYSDYESEAKSTKTEGHDWRRTVRRIIEAEGDAGGPEGEDPPAAEPGSDEPTKMSIEDIDVESFSNSIVRLVDNYDALLEVKNTILRRAANFLVKNYDNEVVESFKEDLRGNHGIDIGKSADETANDQFPAPKAGNAGPIGGDGGAPVG